MQTADADQLTFLLGKNSDLEARLERAVAERDALAARLAEAQQELVAVRAGYRHQLYELRGRIAGTLTGRMERLLGTALAAARAETPRIAVITERLEIISEMLATFVAAERNQN
jgi:hypothetical protein